MDATGKNTHVDTPCIGICSTAIGDSICIGCGRTFDEVNSWNTLTDEEKTKINKRLIAERQSA